MKPDQIIPIYAYDCRNCRGRFTTSKERIAKKKLCRKCRVVLKEIPEEQLELPLYK